MISEEQQAHARARDAEHYQSCRKAGIHPLQGLPAITRNRARRAALIIAEDINDHDPNLDT